MSDGRLNFLVFTALAVLSLQSSAEVFKWVDKAGNVHFGDQPPPGEKSTKENIKPPPGIKLPAVAPQGGSSLLEKDLDFKKRRAERAELEKKQSDEARKKDARTAECTRMQASLTDMESGMKLFDYDKDGQRYILDEERRNKSLNDARKKIQQDCK